MYRDVLNDRGFKRVTLVALLSTLTLTADIDLQRSIYDAADEMMRYDEKMNQAIMRHNQITPEQDRLMRLNDNNIEDFEETEYGYLFKRNIDQGKNIEVGVTLSDGMLNFSTTTITKERRGSGMEMVEKITEKTSTVSLSIPHDADINSMQKTYVNGVLEVKFLKK